MDAFNDLVKRIQPLATATQQRGSKGNLGGFGGVFDLRKAGFKDPLLIAANDGVGTKLAVAIAMNHHDTIGIDLVAMSVNDIVAQGGRPLLFLDYFATSKLDIAIAEKVITGIAKGCQRAGCVLIGGETAEMPGMYQSGDYDLAGFALGACERDDLLPRDNINAGDLLFGLASNGFHANGFSLLRHVLQKKKIEYSAPFSPDSNKSIGEILLQPTRIYAESLINAETTGAIKSLAHITGGGLLDNIPRSLPKSLSARLDLSRWSLPMEMEWFRNLGGWGDKEMARTFNCGIGMVGVAAPEKKEDLFKALREKGETVYEIGALVEGEQERVLLNGAWEVTA